MKFYETFFEVIGWCKIAISPILIGTILAAIIYWSLPTATGIILACMPAVAGIIIGIKWANNIWKTKEGTNHYVSRISSHPELDQKEEEK